MHIKNIFKKFSIGLVILTAIFSSTIQIASAVESSGADAAGAAGSTPGADAPTGTTDATGLNSFNVKSYLTVPPEDETDTSSQGQEYLKSTSNSPIISFILMIIDTLLMIIGTVCMVLIIIGGVLMMSSEGDDNRIQKGKTILTQAIIGLIMAFTSYILVTFVQSLLYVQNIQS